MGKFGCRLYCWGCGGCCIITGIVMGILSSAIPPAWMASIQESAFDLAYIDDTSQTEAEGLFADGGAPIAESDAFKAWGKTITEGMTDCLKADFAFDWSKTPDDCVDGLHPTFTMFNFTDIDGWLAGGKLEYQEVGSLIILRDTWKIEADASYWDETGKARFRVQDKYMASPKCSDRCNDFAASGVFALNIWYGVFAMAGLVDGWIAAHGIAATPPAGTTGSAKLVNDYLADTETVPMDPHSGLPVTMKVFQRLYDLTLFFATPDAEKLGNINVGVGGYNSLKTLLWDTGKTYLESMAGDYKCPPKASPIFLNTNALAVLAWGEVPYWVDPISGAVFTFNFVGGVSENAAYFGATPLAFMEEKMSSSYYHEGLGYVTQHYEASSGSTVYNHSCAWDPDCTTVGKCFPTDICVPLPAAGYDGGKIPGTYFGSSKGQPGLPEFTNFIMTYYLIFYMKSAGRAVVPVKYKGPDAPDDVWNFEGLFAMSTFKATGWNRRIENCNYPEGRLTESGAKDSPGIDCNWVKDTSPLQPYFGLPLYWLPLNRDPAVEGWDPAATNADDGAGSVHMSAMLDRKACTGGYCTDGWSLSGFPSTSALHYGYEPNLGALVDVKLMAGLSWKLSVTSYHPEVAGNTLVPLFWVHNYLHLPAAIQMDLSKLQVVPAALNGFHVFLLGQCMISLVGGIACCFCGV